MKRSILVFGVLNLFFVGCSRAQTPAPTAAATPTPTALPTLRLRLDRTTVNEGEAVQITVLLPAPTTREVKVNFSTNSNGLGGTFRINSPDVVIIQSGQSQARFSISIAQDEQFNGVDFAEIVLSAPGYRDAFARITVINDDRPRLSLSFDVTTIREDEGDSSIRATLSANRFSTENILVRSSNPDRVRVPQSVPLTNGTFLIDIIPDPDFNAPETITISASAQNIDATVATFILLDSSAPRLSLRINPNVVQEGQSTLAARGTLTREGDVSQSISVALTSSNRNQVRVPQSLVFQAGQATATFPITTVDDGAIGRDQTVTISANVAGADAGAIASARANVIVRNSTPFVTASLTRTAFSESAGPRASILVLKLSRPYSRELRVGLGAGNPRLIVPRVAVFPAGSTLISVPIGVRNDERSDSGGNEFVLVFPPFAAVFPPGSATGPGPIRLPVTIFDDDALLTLTLTQTEFSENAGVGAARATVTRRLPTDEPLTVELSVESAPGNDDQTLVRVPKQVVIPPKLRSISFPIDILNNSEPGFAIPQTRFLVARAIINGPPVQAVQARVPLFITDDEPSQIVLEVDSAVVGENGLRRAFVTLRVQGPAPADLTFTIQNSNRSRLQAPTTVVLPAGSTSVTFPVDAIDNTIPDGNARITLTARKTGFGSGNTLITVIDDDAAA